MYSFKFVIVKEYVKAMVSFTNMEKKYTKKNTI